MLPDDLQERLRALGADRLAEELWEQAELLGQIRRATSSPLAGAKAGDTLSLRQIE